MVWTQVVTGAGALLLYIILWRRWKRDWSLRRSRAGRMRLGSTGFVLTLVACACLLLPLAWVARGPYQTVVLIPVAIPIVACWLFFAEMFVRACLRRVP